MRQMQFSKWVAIGSGMLFLVIVAGYFNAQHLYYMAAILLTLPGVSYALGWYSLRGLTFTRDLPDAAWAGEEGDLVYAAQNHTRIARFFLSVNESLPHWIEPIINEPPFFNVSGNNITRVAHRVRYKRRGVYHINHFDVTAIDPLGIFAFTRRISCDSEMVVYPLAQNTGSLSLSGSEFYGWQEFSAAAFRGGSVDPDGVRQYFPGDPLRRIHWRQTAKTGKLAVIEFEETQLINLVVVMDLKSGTDIGEGTETTLEYAVRLTASIVRDAVQLGASIRLLLPHDLSEKSELAASHFLASVSGRGQEHFLLILDALARVEANVQKPLAEHINDAAGNLLPGTTLLVITSQADSLLPDALLRFSATGANVIVVYVDPATFTDRSKHPSEASRQQFFSNLLAIHAHPYILKKDPQGGLNPEEIVHANF